MKQSFLCKFMAPRSNDELLGKQTANNNNKKPSSEQMVSMLTSVPPIFYV